MDVSHIQMGSLQSVLLSVRQGDWMASFDLREAYLQVPVHPASRHFLRFLLRDTVYQFKALCFGQRPVSPSPAPTYRVVSQHDCLSIFVKTLAGSNSLFATSANHRYSIYFSPFRDPRSAGTEAFLQSWDGLQAYAFPSVAVLPRVLALLRAS